MSYISELPSDTSSEGKPAGWRHWWDSGTPSSGDDSPPPVDIAEEWQDVEEERSEEEETAAASSTGVCRSDATRRSGVLATAGLATLAAYDSRSNRLHLDQLSCLP
jgi:hypothetical protein